MHLILHSEQHSLTLSFHNLYEVANVHPRFSQSEEGFLGGFSIFITKLKFKHDIIKYCHIQGLSPAPRLQPILSGDQLRLEPII